MIKTFAILIAVAIAALVLYAANQPDTFSVQRQVTIKAPPEKISALITDFQHWSVWSPYEKLDPSMKRSFSGKASGKGAMYAWDGEGKAGAGSMEIREVTPERITIKLAFLRPMETVNTVEFSFEPRDDATQVTWAMYGPSPFLSKLMGVFVDMDALIGDDFEKGLAALKTAAEQ